MKSRFVLYDTGKLSLITRRECINCQRLTERLLLIRFSFLWEFYLLKSIQTMQNDNFLTFRHASFRYHVNLYRSNNAIYNLYIHLCLFM